MKRMMAFVVLAGLLAIGLPRAWSGNPFTTPPETIEKAPEPPVKSRFFVELILWQHRLNQELSDRIRAARATGDVSPFFFIMGLAFVYGCVHAAGPGHGKFVAMSYALSHRATVSRSLMLGAGIAVIHGFSGVAGVLGLQYVLRLGAIDALDSATRVTRIVSFALISMLGLGILLSKACSLRRASPPSNRDKNSESSIKRMLPWAVAVGLVPCPAVVTVMLFCMSMDAMAFGFLLSACMAAGMGATISAALLAVTFGKGGLIRIAPGKRTRQLEGIVGILSGTAITLFGALFLLASIHAAVY